MKPIIWKKSVSFKYHVMVAYNKLFLLAGACKENLIKYILIQKQL
jgi:hypothetical protein